MIKNYHPDHLVTSLLFVLYPCHAEYFYVLHSSPTLILLTFSIPNVGMYLIRVVNTLILIRLICKKPANQNLQGLPKRDKSGFNRTMVNIYGCSVLLKEQTLNHVLTREIVYFKI